MIGKYLRPRVYVDLHLRHHLESAWGCSNSMRVSALPKASISSRRRNVAGSTLDACVPGIAGTAPAAARDAAGDGHAALRLRTRRPSCDGCDSAWARSRPHRCESPVCEKCRIESRSESCAAAAAARAAAPPSAFGRLLRVARRLRASSNSLSVNSGSGTSSARIAADLQGDGKLLQIAGDGIALKRERHRVMDVAHQTDRAPNPGAARRNTVIDKC